METVSERLWYGEKYILGPMVRANSLPLRLACLEYGATSVYSEEIPCFRAVSSRRFENKILGTVDYLSGKGNSTQVLFRTHVIQEKDKQCCVLQLGASESVSALNAAKVFESDVAAIDINMGCPKHYSISRGMGSELMVKPETAEDIIKTLNRNIGIPISVKTRIFAKEDHTGYHKHNVDIARSVEWVRRLQSCGADAIAVHARTPKEKNCDSTHDSEVYNILRDTLNTTNTPLIYNGDIWDRADILRLRRDRHQWVTSRTTSDDTQSDVKQHTNGCYMLSRAALWDPSVFSTLADSTSDGAVEEFTNSSRQTSTNSTTPTPTLNQLLSRLICLSADTANCPYNTRYLLQQVLASRKMLHSPLRGSLLRVFDLHGLSALIEGGDCEEYVYAEKMRQMSETAEEVSNCGAEGEEYNNNNDPRSDNAINNNTTENTTTTELNDPTSHNIASKKAHKSILSASSKRSKALSVVQNCSSWPGIVSLTSHEYNDSYFDDNYYIAFKRCVKQSDKRPFAYSQMTTSSSSCDVEVGSVGDHGSAKGSGASKFSFGLSYSTTTTVRVKKAKI